MIPKLSTTAKGLLATGLLLAGALPAAASCDGTVARRAADGATFIAESFGYGHVSAKARRGTALREVDIWRGKIDGKTLYMHFGETGVGFGSATEAADYRGRIKWQPAFGFPMGGEWEITSGPMRGKWSTVCDRPVAAPQPVEEQQK